MRAEALIVLIVAAMALLIIQPALASGDDTYTIREYPLPANSTGASAMTVDSAGNVWLIQDQPQVLYKLVRANGTFSNYTLTNFTGADFSGMSVDQLDIVWFTDRASDAFGAYDERDNNTSDFPFNSWNDMAPSSIVRQGDTVWIGCDAEVGEYDLRMPDEPLADHFVYNWNSYLRDIHFDDAGDIWFVEYGKSKVGVYWHVYDKTSEFVIPTNDSKPTCLSIDSLGRLWFVESGANQLGMFDTGTFNFTEYPLPPVDGLTPAISRVATINDTVWLTDQANGRVLEFFPGQDRFAAAQLAEGSGPTFIQPDANGTLWVYEEGSKKLVSLNVTSEFGTVTPTPAPTATPTATPQPTKSPGFLLITAMATLAVAAYLKMAGK